MEYKIERRIKDDPKGVMFELITYSHDSLIREPRNPNYDSAYYRWVPLKQSRFLGLGKNKSFCDRVAEAKNELSKFAMELKVLDNEKTEKIAEVQSALDNCMERI